MSDNISSPTPPRIGPAAIAYVVTLLGALYIWDTQRPQGVWLALIVAAPVVALGWMVRQALARRRVTGCGASPASRAYVRRFVPMMIGYALCLLAATWLNRHVHPTGALAWAIAILPALPMIGVVWAMGRLVTEESDEYQRMLHVRQIMVATGFMLSVTSVWGFLEQFGQVPHLPIYWAFIIWCGGLGVGSLANELRS